MFGLVEPDQGDLLWDGRPVDLTARLRFGYIRSAVYYPRMAGGEQLEYFGRLHRLDARSARVAARHWLERLGFADRAGAKVEELSQGNQRRVQVAAALLREPELLVLDEPFAGLDPVAMRTSPRCCATRHGGLSSGSMGRLRSGCRDIVGVELTERRKGDLRLRAG